MSEAQKVSTKKRSSLTNPFIWIVAIAVVVAIKWDDVSQNLDFSLTDPYVLHGAALTLAIFIDAVRNIKNLLYWLLVLCLSLVAAYLLYGIYFLGGRALIALLFELGPAGDSDWVLKYVFPAINLMFWFASRPSCKQCSQMFSSMAVVAENCASKTFAHVDESGKPFVRYKKVNKDGSPDKRVKDNVLPNSCSSEWDIDRQCSVCSALETTKETRKTVHFGDFSLPKKYTITGAKKI